MKNFRFTTMLMVLLMLLFSASLGWAEKKEVNKSFKPAETVEIKILSGDCQVKKGSGNEIKVNLVYSYPDEIFKPVFEQEGNTLVLKEEFTKGTSKIKGESHWTVTVPEKTKIDFKAASGDFELTGLKSEIQAKVASGDIRLFDLQGDAEAKTASGDIFIKNSTGKFIIGSASGEIEIEGTQGVFDLHTASGDIKNSGIVIKGNSVFKTVSGNLSLKLAKGSDYNLSLSSVSGNIVLDYNGNPVKGYFIFKGMKKEIDSEIPFDNNDDSHHSPFTKKSFKVGESPEVTIKTVSGHIELKK